MRFGTSQTLTAWGYWPCISPRSPEGATPPTQYPEEVNGYFAEMGRIAVDIGTNTRDVVRSADPQSAAQLSRDDDALDDLHRHLFTILMDRQWKHSVSSAVDVTLLSRYYERFADHAVEIGRRVIYQVTGEPPTD